MDQPPSLPRTRGQQLRLPNARRTEIIGASRRNLSLRLRKYGDFLHLSDVEFGELCDRYLQARERGLLRLWAQEGEKE